MLPTSVKFLCHLEEYESAQQQKQPQSGFDSISHVLSTNSSDKLHFNAEDGTSHTAPDLSSSFVTTTFRQKRRMSGQNWFWISLKTRLNHWNCYRLLKSIEFSDNYNFRQLYGHLYYSFDVSAFLLLFNSLKWSWNYCYIITKGTLSFGWYIGNINWFAAYLWC